MVDVDGVEIHPSVIDGRTAEYREFLETWGSHCGAPRAVFRGHLNALIVAELRRAGEELVEEAQAMLEAHRPTHRALARLLADLHDHLLNHDCARRDCLGSDAVTEVCPVRLALCSRISTARGVLGLDGTGA